MWLTIARFEFMQQFQRKAYLFLTFGLPLFILIGALLFNVYQEISGDEPDTEDVLATLRDEPEADMEPRIIGYVDHSAEGLLPAPESYGTAPEDCTPEGNSIEDLTASDIRQISAPGCFQGAVKSYASVEAGLAAQDAGEIDLLFAVDEDFSSDPTLIQYFEEFSIQSLESGSLFESYVLSSLLYQDNDLSAEDYEMLYLRLRTPALIDTQQINASGELSEDGGNEESDLAVAYVFAIAMMLSLFWGGNYLMQTVVQDKENRVIEILMSSATPNTLLTGKILSSATLGLIQLATLGGTALFLSYQGDTLIDLPSGSEVPPLNMLLMITFWILGFLFFGSLLAGLGALATTLREAQSMAPFFIMPALLPYFAISVLVVEPDGGLARVLSLVPITAPMAMIIRLSVENLAAGDILLSLGIMLASVVAAIWFAGRLFRVNVLLMGKMPGIRDIPHLLRG